MRIIERTYEMKNNGFSSVVLVVLLAVLLTGIIGFAGWYVYQNNQKPVVTNFAECAAQEDAKIQETYPELCVYGGNQYTNPAQKTELPTEDTDQQSNYVVVEEWRLKFTKPDSLKDIEYIIVGDTAGFYAKPADFDGNYRKNYKAVDASSRITYAIGRLTRSTNSTHTDNYVGVVEGRKIGDYYYYTAHSFSGLSTGAGYNGLYFNEYCDDGPHEEPVCSELIDAEHKAFQSVNDMLRTIETL